MAKAKSHIPDGFQAVVPYFHVDGAAKFLDFVKAAFDAEETFRGLTPDGKIMHSSAKIGGAVIEVSDATPQWGALPCAIHVYVPDTDATYRRALDAGATSLYEPADMFYGERSAGVTDPFGNKWYIATHTEDLPEEEIEKRQQEFVKKQAQQSQQQ
ncbi:MAG: VOC family protein [Candidatus Hydrogenedentes bacterium]|nr:VOC family protein [Candidatus Hydrogenedentota bacterium]